MCVCKTHCMKHSAASFPAVMASCINAISCKPDLTPTFGVALTMVLLRFLGTGTMLDLVVLVVPQVSLLNPVEVM